MSPCLVNQLSLDLYLPNPHPEIMASLPNRQHGQNRHRAGVDEFIVISGAGGVVANRSYIGIEVDK